MQAQKAKQRYQPFGIKDIYLKKKFVLEKHPSVPYYYRKQKPPKPITKLPPIGRRIAHQLEEDKGHRKNSAVGKENTPLVYFHLSPSNSVSIDCFRSVLNVHKFQEDILASTIWHVLTTTTRASRIFPEST